MNMLEISKFSIGVGDRFAHQAEAQLKASQKALEAGVLVVPVWNKSNREHTTIGSKPASTRLAADAAVKSLGWKGAYHVDADHINLTNVEGFLPHSDFFTIDVAQYIAQPAKAEDIQSFIQRYESQLIGQRTIPGIEEGISLDRSRLEAIVSKYLLAVQEAGRIYRHIADQKAGVDFITEVSMDETDSPQTPPELLVILAALAHEKIPLQTIAPKFTGRFNKGVDYVGNVAQFEKEFREDLAVIAHAVKAFQLPKTLKLSVHSGSDKFSIYAPIRKALHHFNAGVHVKTAGTTWLEELIGLAEAGGEGLVLAKDIYAEAYEHRDELCTPYASVIDIDPSRLPLPETVRQWSDAQYTNALRHIPNHPEFNPHLRQLLHVGYKIAAKMGSRYLHKLEACQATISKNVTENLYHRHLKPLFIDK